MCILYVRLSFLCYILLYCVCVVFVMFYDLFHVLLLPLQTLGSMEYMYVCMYVCMNEESQRFIFLQFYYNCLYHTLIK
jgi:hypothetical protein